MRAGDDRYFHVREEDLAVPASGEAIVGSWWVHERGRGLLFWLGGQRAGDARPLCNASEEVARRLLPSLMRPDAEIRQVPVVFMSAALREAAAVLSRREAESKRVREEETRDPPALGSPEWDALAAAAEGPGILRAEVRGIRREMSMRHADGGEPVMTERDGRLALMPDGRLRSLLTPRDWRLYFASRDCFPAAQALNAALEEAYNSGSELEAAMGPVMERHRRHGADDTDSREAFHGVVAILEGWRSPAPGVS